MPELIFGHSCPVCHTQLNPKGHKALCQHVIWSNRYGWVIREKDKPESAQGQKYSINWRWRGTRRRLGDNRQ